MSGKVLNIANLKKTIHYFQKNGIIHTYYAAKERIEEVRKRDDRYQEIETEILAAQRREGEKLSCRFSIVVPAYETKAEFLREMIESVLRQSYEKWELIIADASESRHVETIVKACQEKDQRIRYLLLGKNKGISENTNAAIEAAKGDYIGLLDHDDLLTADALYEMASAIQKMQEKKKTPVLLYSDEDKYLGDGCYYEKHQKYKFNLDLILSNNYVCHFMVAEAGLMKKLKLRRQYDGAQDYDFVLRVTENLLASMPACELENKITHVPKVLYHWRAHADSTAENTASKTYAYEAGRAAVADFCERRGWKVKVSHALHLGFYQIEYLPDLFTVRDEAGIVGGRILDRRNRIISGIFDENGNRLYPGLHRAYSGGSTHRASLSQDCAAVDIRCMRVRRELQPVFEKITGVSYRESGKQKLADVSAVVCDEEGYRKLSLELGKAAAERGYLVVWDPGITIRKG